MNEHQKTSTTNSVQLIIDFHFTTYHFRCINIKRYLKWLLRVGLINSNVFLASVRHTVY